MIKMQNVRKTYPGFDFELSLEIPEGRITGLIGKNGAGKSTAIRLMLGLVKAESGTIELTVPALFSAPHSTDPRTIFRRPPASPR